MARYLLLAAFVGLAALTLHSFYEDNHEVEATARRLACSGHAGTCAPRLARFERTPLRQTFVFRFGARDMDVTCRRAWGLMGAYSCHGSSDP